MGRICIWIFVLIYQIFDQTIRVKVWIAKVGNAMLLRSLCQDLHFTKPPSWDVTVIPHDSLDKGDHRLDRQAGSDKLSRHSAFEQRHLLIRCLDLDGHTSPLCRSIR